MKQIIIKACVFFVCMGFSTGTCFAGGRPSVESCEKIGFVNCSCIICESGVQIGLVGVKAEYDPKYGDCLKRYKEARSRCAAAYGKDLSEVGTKWSYSMVGTTYTGIYPNYCSSTAKTRSKDTRNRSTPSTNDRPYKTSN